MLLSISGVGASLGLPLWGTIALLVFLVVIIIGIIRMLFSSNRNDGIGGFFMDLLLIDLLFDMFSITFELLGEILSDL